MQEAYLRAALSEFAELDSSATRDVRGSGWGEIPRLKDLENPMFHIFSAFRNVAVHVETGRLDSKQKKAHLELLDREPKDFDLTIWMLGQETVSCLDDRKRMSGYSKVDCEEMKTWILWAQAKWGIQEVIRLAVDAYARNVCQHLNL